MVAKLSEEHRKKLSIAAKEAWTRIRVKTNPEVIYCQYCGNQTLEWTEISHTTDYKLKLKICYLCQTKSL